MNSKTLYSHPYFGSYEELQKMPRLVFRVLCAYLFDYADCYSISSDDLVDLLSAPYALERGVVNLRRILKHLNVFFIRVEKHSDNGIVQYLVELKQRNHGFVSIS